MNLPQSRIVLCPIDFSDHTRRTLEEAVRQTEKFDGRLIVLHVLNERGLEEIERWQGRVQALGTDVAAQAAKALGDERERMLREVLAELDVSRVPHTSIITRGYPAEEILKLAKEEKVDLIVMGVKGRTALSRQLAVGSRAEKVFRRAECNILFVH